MLSLDACGVFKQRYYTVKYRSEVEAWTLVSKVSMKDIFSITTTVLSAMN